MHISTSPIFCYWLETTKNTTISIFNAKKIRNLQFPLLITDLNFRLGSGNNNIILWAFSIPFTRRHTHSGTTITASGYTQQRKTKGIATTDSKYLPSYSSDLTVLKCWLSLLAEVSHDEAKCLSLRERPLLAGKCWLRKKQFFLRTAFPAAFRHRSRRQWVDFQKQLCLSSNMQIGIYLDKQTVNNSFLVTFFTSSPMIY